MPRRILLAAGHAVLAGDGQALVEGQVQSDRPVKREPAEGLRRAASPSRNPRPSRYAASEARGRGGCQHRARVEPGASLHRVDEGLRKECVAPHIPTWNCRAIGHFEDVLDRILRDLPSCENGMLQGLVGLTG